MEKMVPEVLGPLLDQSRAHAKNKVAMGWMSLAHFLAALDDPDFAV